MNQMTPRRPLQLGLRAAGAGLLTLVIAACAGGAGAAWTYAPLGPTADPAASPTAGPSGTPGPTPGLALEVSTPQEQATSFVPDSLDAPAATVVQVNYLNDSSLPHNIKFFEGTDSSAPVLGETEDSTGPDVTTSVTITTPETPGDYYFWCDIHGASMAGTLHIQ
jgi:plastocyanin